MTCLLHVGSPVSAVILWFRKHDYSSEGIHSLLLAQAHRTVFQTTFEYKTSFYIQQSPQDPPVPDFF